LHFLITGYTTTSLWSVNTEDSTSHPNLGSNIFAQLQHLQSATNQNETKSQTEHEKMKSKTIASHNRAKQKRGTQQTEQSIANQTKTKWRGTQT